MHPMPASVKNCLLAISDHLLDKCSDIYDVAMCLLSLGCLKNDWSAQPEAALITLNLIMTKCQEHDELVSNALVTRVARASALQQHLGRCRQLASWLDAQDGHVLLNKSLLKVKLDECELSDRELRRGVHDDLGLPAAPTLRSQVLIWST